MQVQWTRSLGHQLICISTWTTSIFFKKTSREHRTQTNWKQKSWMWLKNLNLCMNRKHYLFMASTSLIRESLNLLQTVSFLFWFNGNLREFFGWEGSFSPLIDTSSLWSSGKSSWMNYKFEYWHDLKHLSGLLLAEGSLCTVLQHHKQN